MYLLVHLACSNQTSDRSIYNQTHLSTGSCSWYNTKACSPCNCYEDGSVNMKCDKDGRCTCKPGFYGKKCSDKDCVMSAWRWLSKCQCGPGKTRTRSRSILTHPLGNGKPCGGKTDTEHCNLKCQCKEYQFGDYCEHQNCVLGEWEAWETVYLCTEPTELCCHSRRPLRDERLHQRRYKPTIIERRGNGKYCGNPNDINICIELSCRVPTWWQRQTGAAGC